MLPTEYKLFRIRLDKRVLHAGRHTKNAHQKSNQEARGRQDTSRHFLSSCPSLYRPPILASHPIDPFLVPPLPLRPSPRYFVKLNLLTKAKTFSRTSPSLSAISVSISFLSRSLLLLSLLRALSSIPQWKRKRIFAGRHCGLASVEKWNSR